MDTYLDFLQNHQEQKDLYPSIEEYRLLEESQDGEGNTHQLFYLSYKKVGFISQRDFVYYRQIRRVSPVSCFVVSRSVPDIQDLVAKQESIVRGDMITSGTIVT